MLLYLYGVIYLFAWILFSRILIAPWIEVSMGSVEGTYLTMSCRAIFTVSSKLGSHSSK